MIYLPWKEWWWALPELRRVRPTHWSFVVDTSGRAYVTAHNGEEEVSYLFKELVEGHARLLQFPKSSMAHIAQKDLGEDIGLDGKHEKSKLVLYLPHGKEVSISGWDIGNAPKVLPRRKLDHYHAEAWWERFREASRFVGDDDSEMPLDCIHYNGKWLKATDGSRAVTLFFTDRWGAFAEEVNIPPTPYLLTKRSTFPFAKRFALEVFSDRMTFCSRPWYYTLPINQRPYPVGQF